MRKIHYILIVLLLAVAEVLLVAVRQPAHNVPREMKVLCIGNSFSIDAVENNLVELAAERGIDLTVGNLYIGGCSLERHAMNMRGDSAVYSYRLMRTPLRLSPQKGASDCPDVQVMTCERTVTDSVSILQALASDEWDVVTMQQASHYSGQWFTYEPWLSELIDSVRLHIQDKTKIYWYMTWAYQQDAKHPAFVPNYNGSQAYMYDEILGCNRQVLANHPFDGFIPGGIAVQQARATKLGDTFCRDGYHLNYTYGRYTAACVWYEILTGKNVRHNKYKNPEMSAKQRRLTQKSAHRAVKEYKKKG